jgi:hypothetical protein
MKWIGQHIWDFISRFRADVYIENLSYVTPTDILTVDSSGKVSKGKLGWHGDIRIKILPRDFVANDVGRPLMIEDDSVGSNELFLHSFSTSDAFAYVPIPAGYKATHVRIYGNTSGENFYVYEGNIDSKTIVDIATGTTAIGSEKTLGTQLTSDTTNYLIIRVTSGGATEEIHGGYVTIAQV